MLLLVQFNLSDDLGILGLSICFGRFFWVVMKSLEDIIGFVQLSLPDKVTWRLWNEAKTSKKSQRTDAGTCKGKPPAQSEISCMITPNGGERIAS